MQSVVLFCLVVAAFLCGSINAQVSQVTQYNGTASSGTQLIIYNNVNGNIMTTQNGGVNGQFMINVDVQGDTQNDLNSVTVSWTQSGNAWILAIDGPLTGGGSNNNNNNNSSGADRVVPTVVLLAFLASFLSFFFVPSRRLALLLVGLIAISAGATVYAAGNVRADVTIYLPPDLVGQLGTVLLGGLGSGTFNCDSGLANCGTRVDASSVDGFWLFSAEFANSAQTATYDDSNVCMGGSGCPAGIVCIAAGGINKWVFNASASHYIHYTNVKTGSDFNTAGTYLLYSNNIMSLHKKREWSCAHAGSISGGQGQFDRDSYEYASYRVDGANIGIGGIGGLPTTGGAPVTYTQFRQVSQTDLYNKYSIGKVCQDCVCICISGTTQISPPDSYTICNSCVVTCRSPSDGSCTCLCADDCKEFWPIMTGPFMGSCSQVGRSEPSLEAELRELFAM